MVRFFAITTALKTSLATCGTGVKCKPRLTQARAGALFCILMSSLVLTLAGCAPRPVASSGGSGFAAYDGGGQTYEYSFENFDADAEYTLYTIRVEREHGDYAHMEKVYVGADFVVDVSKTQIVADGFGYAANQYGAVRVSSLSDGFDIGIERHLYILGDDIKPEFKAYKDPDLIDETDAVTVDAVRRGLTPREYLLEFSALYALHMRDIYTYTRKYISNGIDAEHIGAADGDQRESGGDMGPDGREALFDSYVEDLYRSYGDALDELLKIHYFIPRGELYAKAETY